MNPRCEECPFNGRPRVSGFGAPPEKARAVIIGESPGRQEVRYGRPFVGPTGRLLRGVLAHAGFTVLDSQAAREPNAEESEVYFTNAGECLPIGGDIDQYKTSDAKKVAAKCCFQRLKAELGPYAEAGVPLCAVGGSSSLVMVGNAAITKIRSRWHIKRGIRVLTTWHPAYVLRNPWKVGELVRDMSKLAHGGPIYEKLGGIVKSVESHDAYSVIGCLDKLLELEQTIVRGCASGAIKDGTVCLDIESDNVRWWEDRILCYGFAWGVEGAEEGKVAAIIPGEMVYTPEVRDFMIRLFDDPNIKWLGHNFKFDVRFIRHQTGVPNVRMDYDSLIADHIVDENRKHALKDLLAERYDIPDYEAHLVQRYLKNKNDRYSKVPAKHLYHYCAYDCIWTLMLWRDLRKEMEQEDLFEQPFLFPTMATQGMLLDMELHGMLVDVDQMRKLSVELRGHLNGMLEELRDAVGGIVFNANSPKQVSHIMYDVLKLPKQRIRGLKPVSTAEAVRIAILAQLASEGKEDSVGYRWIEMYSSWKKLEKIRSSYTDNTLPLIDGEGRVHPDILVYSTETGRLSVRSPALQTIPRVDTARALGEAWGRRIKQCYIVPEGYTMAEIDYSQAELRTAAWYSQDPFLLQCYEDGRDIHGEVAEAFWPGWTTMEDEVERKFLRKRTKMCVFGRLYLGGKATIADTLHCTLRQAEAKLAILDSKLGGLVGWENEQWELMKTRGYVETLTKRRRRVPLITRDNADDSRKAACNMPIQGTASEATTISSIQVHEWIRATFGQGAAATQRRPHILMLQHDSAILEIPNEMVRRVCGVVQRIMEKVASEMMPGIPWETDVELGSSWGDLEEVKAERE